MRTLKTVFFVMLPLLYVLSGCTKKSEAPAHATYTPEQNKKALETSASNVITNLNSIKSSTGMASLMNMLIYSNESSPFGAKKNTNIPVVSHISSLLQFDADPSSVQAILKGMAGDRLIYTDMVGKYTWNAANKTWVKTASSSIVFNFPSTNGGSSNNASLTITDYKDMQVTTNGVVDYRPTLVKFNMTVDGTKQLDLAMTAGFKADGTPTAMSISFFMNPFTLAMNYTNTSTIVSIDTKWTVGSDNIIAAGYKLTGNFSSISSTDELPLFSNTIEGYLQIADAKMTANIDVAHLRALNTPSAADINKYVAMSLKWSDDTKIADCVLVFKTMDDDPTVQLKFADGTTSNADVYFDAAMLKFQNFLKTIAQQ